MEFFFHQLTYFICIVDESLQTVTRDKILQCLKSTQDIDRLPLPKQIKKFLKYDAD